MLHNAGLAALQDIVFHRARRKLLTMQLLLTIASAQKSMKRFPNCGHLIAGELKQQMRWKGRP